LSSKRLAEFNDDVREFHVIDGVPMPSVKKWVSLEADVVSGDEVCYNPRHRAGSTLLRTIQALCSPRLSFGSTG
jgi:hypothetical protein